MFSRRAILVFCLLLSALLHAYFLFFVAPNVTMMRANAAAQRLQTRYNVKLAHTVHDSARAFERSASKLASRPGEIRDLVLTGEGPLSLPPSGAKPTPEVPNLESRLASDPVARTYEFAPDAQVMRSVEAKIIEIPVDIARRDLNVARRLVQPSPVRVLEEGEFPLLRVPAEDIDAGVLRLPSSARSLLAGAAVPPGNAAAPVIGAPAEPPVPIPAAAADDGSGAAVPNLETSEVFIARTPVVEAVRAQRSVDYTFLDDLLDISVETFRNPGEDLGFFRLRIAPKKDAGIEPIGKDITFVLDASTSISQRKLDISAKGISRAIDALGPDDRFNVVVFRDTPILFQPEPVPAANENRAAAKSFIANLESRGETDVYRAMQSVVQTTPRPGHPGVIFLVSDGRPTAGIRDSRAIINGFTADNEKNTFFALGGGRTVNRYLLDLLAYRNRGEARVLDKMEGIEKGVQELHQNLAEPLLVDLRADYSGIDQEQVFPRRLPDFYGDRPIEIFGRYTPGTDREFVLRLSGVAGDRRKEVFFRAKLDLARQGDRAVARDWAFAKGYYIIGEISRLGEQPDLLGELRALSSAYGFKTVYDE